ncbi:phage portal protein [Micromonospora sp. 4G55]|uniref:phage portal protein n=1 Tax=Micromonospora sp. 4G55 TaxID=2806102 RepID=UPI002812801A|nr:phage portal protein [Micromonospora sp. 4G55]
MAVQGGSNINYANITQRNLQFLIMHLGPAVARREKNLTKLLSRPRYVKLNTDALLRMDPLERAKVITEKIKNRTMTPTEARALDDNPPLTAQQIQEFTDLFGEPGKASDQRAADTKEGTS